MRSPPRRQGNVLAPCRRSCHPTRSATSTPATTMSPRRATTRNGGSTSARSGKRTRCGDGLAGIPRRAASALAPGWRLLLRARPASARESCDGEHELEHFVDIHAFVPRDLERFVRDAGFVDVDVRGEELLANW